MDSAARFWNDKNTNLRQIQRPDPQRSAVAWRYAAPDSSHCSGTSRRASFESEARPRLVTRILKSYWTYSVVALIGLIVHLEAAMPVYTATHRLFGWILLLSLLYFLWQYANQSFKSFPVLVLVTFQFYLFYGLPQFSQD